MFKNLFRFSETLPTQGRNFRTEFSMSLIMLTMVVMVKVELFPDLPLAGIGSDLGWCVGGRVGALLEAVLTLCRRCLTLLPLSTFLLEYTCVTLYRVRCSRWVGLRVVLEAVMDIGRLRAICLIRD